MMLDGDKTYQHKRTKYLQKIKEMKDKEFEIVDMNLGKGRFSSTLGYITIKLPTGERKLMLDLDLLILKEMSCGVEGI